MDIKIDFCGSGSYPDSVFCMWYSYLTKSCPCDFDIARPLTQDFDACDAGGNEYFEYYAEWHDLDPGTYYYPIASYTGNPIGFVVTISGAKIQACNSDALFGQNPSENGESAQFYGSEAGIGVASADRFTGLSGDFNKISWWGGLLDDDLSNCDPQSHDFRIIFCRNNLSHPTIPGDTVSIYDVSTTPVATAVSFDGIDEYKFEAGLIPPVQMSSGWMIIRGNDDDGCYFFWQDAHDGSGATYDESAGEWQSISHDLSFCLYFDSTIVGIDNPHENLIPERTSLIQNYPNPFNATTSINFVLRNTGDVTLEIYDISGRLVKTVYDGNLAAGTYSVIWDGTGKSGDVVSSGIYFYRLKSADGISSKSMVLLK
jgi:hypothetical protein